ncbi:MAG: chromosome segregation protein SMC [Gemmataceae bacterium]
MLKRLELIGFKSFADRTVFDFAAGITAVVGPNGSGKSNVVDAVKWVLGEQSVKSLRGTEMADVIFNGSTSRKGVSVAEVALIFDNSKSILAIPAAEVCVIRRVYRDGRGEYLINGQECRLRDIKDLFLGTGSGANAYSIIEQGRVDALLQASNEDRRAIFEEAAGVSRFKAKKIDCLRRLERVGENLTRLRDILGEVEHQLRSVRLQAAKAQKHRELSTRLRELRLGLALREYQTLTKRIAQATEQLDTLRTALDSAAHHSAAESEAARKIASELAELELQSRGHEQAVADTRGRLAALDAIIGRDRALATELEADFGRTRSNEAELTEQLTGAETSLADTTRDLAEVQHSFRAHEAQVRTLAEGLATAAAAVEQTRIDLESEKKRHLQCLRSSAKWQNETVACKALAGQLTRDRDRLTAKDSDAVGQLAALDLELAGLMRADAELQSRLAEARLALTDRMRERDTAREESQDLQSQLAHLRAQASGLTSRMEVLESLDQGRDGLNSGISEMLDLLENSPEEAGWPQSIIGLVADCLHAPHDIAPLVDLALGPLSQCFLVRDTNRFLIALDQRKERLSGRAGFVPVAAKPPKQRAVPQGYEARRVSDLVTSHRSELRNLPRQLLSNTLLVHDLETAREIAEDCPGWRYVTQAGEVLEADGTLTIGNYNADAGLLSRKSELRDLKTEGASIAERVETLEFDLEWASERAEESDAQVEQLREQIEVLAGQEADLRTRLGRHRERRLGIGDEVADVRRELESLEAGIRRAEEGMRDAEREAHDADQSAREHQARIDESIGIFRDQEQQLQAARQQHSAAEIVCVQLRERMSTLEARQQSCRRDIEDRRRLLIELEARRGSIEERLARCRVEEQSALDEQSTLRDQLAVSEREMEAIAAQRLALKENERQLQEGLQTSRGAWQKQRDELHAAELAASEYRHRRDGLIVRLAEDYQIDLVQAHTEDRANGAQSAALDGLLDDAIRSEIEELRKKLDRLGGVSLDSLDELSTIETKAQTLQAQLDDLTKARASLEEVLQKINADSKALFVETFAGIRQHFQELFRRLFGGGMADVVLEKPDDPLESAIDIIAKPPGKETRTISLMSGGERTLTAIALLLAIFRSKPSPFCLLDEVDAALDEANAARLASVLQEFAATSQFIIITHAKRTMAAADMLYGVTMQESGISKRVAIRFEDWEGEKRQAA